MGAAVGLASLAGTKLESVRNEGRDAEETEVRFEPALALYGTAGYGGLLSSVSWVELIFDYAGVIFDGKPGTGLPHRFEFVSALDTNWAYPSIIAGWTLTDIQGVKPTVVFPFLEQGARRFPAHWEFRITWAQCLLTISGLDSATAYDSAAKILMPLSKLQDSIPEYARHLAFTLLHKSGKPQEAMDILVQTYRQVPDPLIRIQFRNKIADLLQRNQVLWKGDDSAAFFQAMGGMLESDEVSQIEAARSLLVRLVQPEHQVQAMAEAHDLAEQFKAYQKQATRSQ